MSAQAALKVQESDHAYDEVPYSQVAHPFTHPQHLYTVGTLFGLTPPDFKTARVLELGGASGGNLFPLALNYPKAQFTGIDLSQAQVAAANRQKQALNLTNVEFLQQDILKFAPKKAAKFDYIIVHGILSWVPEPVRNKILEICRDWLSDNGLAVISYNTLPGWNAVRSMREMMQYHISRFTTTAEKIDQAHALLVFLAENVPDQRATWKTIIEEEIKLLNSVNDRTFILHDHLESVNTQFYLHEFVRQAQESGLDYVGDCQLAGMFLGNMPQKAVETLQALNDVVSQEQYMDFISNRRFRSSIVCKARQPIKRALDSEQIMNYYLTLNPLTQIAKEDPKKEIQFKIGEVTYTVTGETSCALFLELHKMGQKPIAATDLIERVRKQLGHADDSQIKPVLTEAALRLVLLQYMNLYSDCPTWKSEVSQKPVAFPLARLEAAHEACSRVTNVMGNIANTDLFANLLIQQADGLNTVAEMSEAMVAHVKSGKLKMGRDGQQLTDEAEIRREMKTAVEKTLALFARNGLLIA